MIIASLDVAFLLKNLKKRPHSNSLKHSTEADWGHCLFFCFGNSLQHSLREVSNNIFQFM